MATAKAKEKNEKTINSYFEEIEKLIGDMENPDESLEDSFEKYKKGVMLIKECSEKIEKVEKELKILEASDKKA